MLPAGLLFALLAPAAGAAQTAPAAAPSPVPSPSPSPSASANAYIAVGYRASSLSVPYGTAGGARGAAIMFGAQLGSAGAAEIRYDGDSFTVKLAATPLPAATPIGLAPAPPAPPPGLRSSAINRFEARYYVTIPSLPLSPGIGFASFTNGTNLPQYPALNGFGLGAALVAKAGTSPYGSIFFYPSLRSSGGGSNANGVVYRAGLHYALAQSALFAEFGFDGESVQNPSGGVATPIPGVSLVGTSGGTQTRNALTVSAGVRF